MHAPHRGQTDAGEASFIQRHVGPSPADTEMMLAAVGAKSLDALIAEVIPASIRHREPLALAPAMSEQAALSRMRAIAGKNEVFTSLIGQGYYGTILPPVIQRNILENPGWYTAYTPYQPEISQGRLEALMNFQTMVADLTQLPVANASLLDEATAAAEAMTLAHRAANAKTSSFFVDRNVHPQTLAVLRVRAEPLGIDLVVGAPGDDLSRAQFFGALFQYPDTFGTIGDYREAIAAVHTHGGLAILAADPLALTLLTPPGELGADIAIGSTQRFGVPMGFGGPHAAYMAVRDELKRSMPGRIVGLSIDARGAPAYRLALQTREQHIRREKATSNICTAQVLLAVIASMYAVYHGPEGLAAIARRVQRRTAVLAEGLRELGFTILNDTFFDTLTVAVGDRQAEILARARAERINLRAIAPGACGAEAAIGVSLDETTDETVVEAVWRAFGRTLAYDKIAIGAAAGLPSALLRQSDFLRHPVFHRHRCETEMLRYMRRLSDRDLALDRAMIPLGSCTMKLNATAEMIPITWPEFADLHPFAPPEQARGYRELVSRAFAHAGAGHRLRRRVVAAELRRAGRICRVARDPRLPSRARRGAAHGLPHSVLGARDQPGIGRHGRAEGGGRGLRQAGQCRSGRSGEEGRAARPRTRLCDDHLSLHPRRVRGAYPRHLRHRPYAGRTGLSRRRQPQCAGRPRTAGRLRRRCQPHQPAQDVLHPAWRRRPRHGADRRQGASRPVPARPSRPRRLRGEGRPGLGRALRVRVDPADLLCLHSDDGRSGPAAGDRDRDPVGELHRRTARPPLSRALQEREGARRA